MVKRKTVKRKCLNCGNEFDARLDSVGKYCSRRCAGRFRNRLNADKFEDGFAWKAITCHYCGKDCFVKLWSYRKRGYGFCSRRCSQSFNIREEIQTLKTRIGDQNPNWRGGTSPYRQENGLAHRIIVEKELGRKLTKGEQVHHIDGDKKNNDFGNLIVVTHKQHKELHWQLERIAYDLIQKGLIIFDRKEAKYINALSLQR